MASERLYVIVRQDLARGLKTAQACHAALLAGIHFKDVGDCPFMIVLETREDKLEDIVDMYKDSQLHNGMLCFHEPDLDNQLTAVALRSNEKTQVITKKIKRMK